MNPTTAAEGIILLIEHARDERNKAAERMAAAKQDVDRWDERLRGYQTTLADLNELFSPEERSLLPIDRAIRTRYEGRTIREMIRLWMQDNNGLLRANEMVTTLTNSGLFRDKTQGAGSIYPLLMRMEKSGEVIKIKPGSYKAGPAAKAADQPEVLRLGFSDEDSISR